MSNVLNFVRQVPRAATQGAGLHLLDAVANGRHDRGDVLWLKENAEVLRFFVCAGLDGAELGKIHGETVATLAKRLQFFPQYYRFFLSIALDLERLGVTGICAASLVRQAFRDGLPQAELSDLQRAEARLFAQQAGLTAEALMPGLTGRLLDFASRKATFALPNRKAAYELTHIVFYLGDYGARPVTGADRLIPALEFAGLVAWIEQNIDLLSEVCIALRHCGAIPPPLWEQRVSAALSAMRVQPSGGDLQDGYHCWLMASWARATAGGEGLPVLLPAGRLRFSAPPGPSALAEISAELYRLGPARSGDWDGTRRRLQGRVSPAALGLLDQAAAAIPAFRPFFERFCRPVRAA